MFIFACNLWHMTKYIVLFLSFLFSIGIIKAQDNKPFELGIIRELQSTELNEKRILNIYLPEGYHKDSVKKYPVIYLLDGSSNEDFIHTVGLVQFLTMINSIPASIVVGIGNVDRKRDFTFPSSIEGDRKLVPTSGGSAKFMSFIEKELQPFVRQNYNVSSESTIIGQSLGGLFATEVLLKKPSLFENYVIVSPSLWWDSVSLLENTPALLKTPVSIDTRVFICVGNEGKEMMMPAMKLTSLLKSNYKRKEQIEYTFLPDESHLTILHRSLYKAFEFLYPKP